MTRLSIALAVVLLATAVSAQSIRRWQMPDGTMHYGDNPPAGSREMDSFEPSQPSTLPASTAVENDSPSRARRQAAEACQREISGRFRDPAVRFGDVSVSELEAAAYAVSGSMTAENATGRAVTSNWNCQARIMGFDRWRVTLAFRDAEGSDVTLEGGAVPLPPREASLPAPAPAPRYGDGRTANRSSAERYRSDAYYDSGATSGSERSGSERSSSYDAGVASRAPGSSGDYASLPPPAPLEPRLSPRGRAVEFSGEPKISWGNDTRKTVDFCVQNFSDDWRKVAIRIGDEQHQIGFVGPRQTTCDKLDTTGLPTGNASEMSIEERIASQDELGEFGVGRR